MILSHFGIKPVRGGSPASDIRRSGMSIWYLWDVRLVVRNCGLLVVFEEFRIIKIGDTIMQYRTKYRIDMFGEDVVSASIHPI